MDSNIYLFQNKSVFIYISNRNCVQNESLFDRPGDKNLKN